MTVRGRAAGAAAAVLALTLAGCSASTEPSNPTTGEPSGVATVIRPGEQVEVPVDGGTLELVLDSAEVVSSCPGRGVPTQEPSLGHFLVLELTATLAPGAGAATSAETRGELYAPLGAELFRVAAPDGTFQPISSTTESWECFEDAELLPAFVDAGDTVSGKLVLDVVTEHGTVSYAPRVAADWYWEY